MDFGDDFFEWVERHRNDDPLKLRLRYGAKVDKPVWLDVALGEIASRPKLDKKLEDCLFPEIAYPLVAVEQCSSKQTALLHADILAKILKPGDTVLDMTCGLGIDAFFMAERGFRVTAVELDPVRADIAKRNFSHISEVKIVQGDSVEYLRNSESHYGAIFIDPARRDGEGKRVYGIADCRPDLLEILPLIACHTNVLLAKLSPMLDVSKTLEELPHSEALYIVGATGECKELLADVRFSDSNTMPKDRIPICLCEGRKEVLRFTLEEESAAKKRITYATPRPGERLYIPSAVAMKAGCFGVIAEKTATSPIAANSHLFVGRAGVEGFPGKEYEIVEVLDWRSTNIKNLHKHYPYAEVSCRNFPINSDQLARRLKVKPGSDCHIFATQDGSNQKLLLITRRV